MPFRRPKGENSSNITKNYGSVRVTASNSLEEADDPLDLLRGRDAPTKESNHSHFEWGASVTRSPAHLARQK